MNKIEVDAIKCGNFIKTETKTQYGILLQGKNLARISTCGNDSFDTFYEITDDPTKPEWFVESPEQLEPFLTYRQTCMYNTTDLHPSWGKFSQKDFTPVCVQTTVRIEPIEVKLPFVGDNKRLLDTWDIRPDRSKAYTNVDISTYQDCVFSCVNYHKSEMEKHLNQRITFGIGCQRILLAVVDVSEECLKLCQQERSWKQENGTCGLVMSKMLY